MSVRKMFTLATSPQLAPQSVSTVRDARQCLARLASRPAFGETTGRRIEADLTRQPQAGSPARTAGEYGPATGGAFGVMTGSTAIVVA